MNQSSVIAGALVLAFIVFITTRGELPCYMQVLGIASGAGCNLPQVGGNPAPGIGSGGSPIKTVSDPTFNCSPFNELCGPGGTSLGFSA